MPSITRRNFLTTCATLPILAALAPQAFIDEVYAASNTTANETPEQRAKRTRWWREAKFGLFIHWGIYSVPANAEKGAEWYFNGSRMQVSEYEKFAAQFDPEKFDADKWVRAARDAGMKYITFTTKHHDGFCMFDSKLTDYTIVKATPFKRDPLKELAAACHKYGLTLCLYHSIMDWHHPDYLPRRPWDTRPVGDADLNRYLTYMKGQLRELLTNYGPIGTIWFDGGWEHTAEELHSAEVNTMIRTLQPGILINDRNGLLEDFITPEQNIPDNAFAASRLWETCMTMNGTWGYTTDNHDWKSPEDLTQKLSDIASKGGNFLLNVGPTSAGEFPPEALERLAAVGRWMKDNGQSIYATQKSPFKHLDFAGRCTQKGKTLYLHVFQWPEAGLTLTGLTTKAREARLIEGNQRLPITQKDDLITIARPNSLDPFVTVIALDLTEAAKIAPQINGIKADASGTLSLTASNVDILGMRLFVEKLQGVPSVGYWLEPKDSIGWEVTVPAEGDYSVTLDYSCAAASAGNRYRFSVDGKSSAVESATQSTGVWTNFQKRTLETPLHLSAGYQRLILIPLTLAKDTALMNLRSITLTRVP